MAPGLLVSLSPSSAVAEDRPVRRAELLLFGSGSTGRISAGVYIELVPGWHLYWVNPGDAGLAPEVHWRLPAGFEPGALRFPTPEKLVEGDLVSYVYRGDVLLLCDITTPRAVPAKAQPALTAVLDWMACREICLIGRETLTADPAALAPSWPGSPPVSRSPPLRPYHPGPRPNWSCLLAAGRSTSRFRKTRDREFAIFSPIQSGASSSPIPGSAAGTAA
jgi:hypothetical protein